MFMHIVVLQLLACLSVAASPNMPASELTWVALETHGPPVSRHLLLRLTWLWTHLYALLVATAELTSSACIVLGLQLYWRLLWLALLAMCASLWAGTPGGHVR